MGTVKGPRKIRFSNPKEKLLVTVEIPERFAEFGGHIEMFARMPTYRKWWKFWKNTYKDIPTRIVGLETTE